MNDTSLSLLAQLNQAGDGSAWSRLVTIYTPLIRNWLMQRGAKEQDADDVSQEVLAVVVRRMPEFQHNQRTGAFRAWLRTITVNCLRDFWKTRKNHPLGSGDSEMHEMLNQLSDPDSALSQLWNEEHDRHVTRQLLQLIRDRFDSKTWQAFELYALQNLPADEVAKQLGITNNAVFIAKSRVLTRLRQEGAGLVE